MVGRASRLLVVLATMSAALGTALPAISAAEAGGVGIRLLDAPVDRKDDPRAQVYIVDHVAPGAVISRRIEVSNLAGTRNTMQLYPVAATLTQGGFKVADGRTPNELTEWISVTPSSLSLGPHGAGKATVQISVPKAASSGERYATVIAELPAKRGGSGTTVSVATRVGIRVYLDVGPGGEPASDFKIDQLTARRAPDGTPEVTATVTNTGGRAIDLTGKLNLTGGPGGLRAGPFAVDSLRTLGVKASGDVLVKLDKSLPAGPWLARMDMQSGRVQRSATATITFPDKGAAAPVKAKLVEGKKSQPWLPIAGGVGGALVIGLILFFFFKRRSRPEDKRDQRPDVVQY
ncbi:MAG: hypothetical protein QOI82_1598 [Actinomycetota bacterium]|nr:hypothetical protein [Actinomycetota bacterium]